MSNKKVRFILFLLSGLFLFLDRFLKWQAANGWTEKKLINEYLGWQPYFNSGIAFGLPMTAWLILVLSAIIISLIIYFIYLNLKTANTSSRLVSFSLSLALAGALSNFFDRLVYGHTVDYLSVFTSIFNLADILIVMGFLIYFYLSSRKISKRSDNS
ncbi:MAG: signal peptidase II [Patescibacteria group bacterium]|jgi:signal peptidase II|nr:signal peptidase II [Patescibacteria group bacterium]